MHKHTALALSGIILATALAACSEGSDSQGGIPMEFREFTCENVGAMADPTGGDSLFIVNKREAMLPVRLGDHDLTALKDTLLAIADMEVNSNGSYRPRGIDYKAVDKAPDAVQTESVSDVALSVVRLAPDIIIWQAYQYVYYEQAAHGMNATLYVNYLVDQNKVLSLSDILVKGKEGTALAQVREKLADPQSGAFEDMVDTDELTANFYLTKDSLVFVYQPYEVGPYSSGVIEVSIPAWQLEDSLTPLGKQLLNID